MSTGCQEGYPSLTTLMYACVYVTLRPCKRTQFSRPNWSPIIHPLSRAFRPKGGRRPVPQQPQTVRAGRFPLSHCAPRTFCACDTLCQLLFRRVTVPSVRKSEKVYVWLENRRCRTLPFSRVGLERPRKRSPFMQYRRVDMPDKTNSIWQSTMPAHWRWDVDKGVAIT